MQSGYLYLIYTITLHTKLKYLLVSCLFSLLIANNSIAASTQIDVTLNPLSPFTNTDGTGLSIDFFNAIESHSSYRFTINSAHFDAAKLRLRRQETDIIGHIGMNYESKSLDKFLQRIDFRFPMMIDLYVKDPAVMDQLHTLKIGVLRGSQQIAANVSGIPISQFTGFSNLNKAFKNLAKGTIDAIYYERASLLNASKAFKIKGLYFIQRPANPLYFGYATAKSEQGDKLKAALDKIILKMDTSTLFKGYQHYMDMPQKGLVKDFY